MQLLINKSGLVKINTQLIILIEIAGNTNEGMVSSITVMEVSEN